LLSDGKSLGASRVQISDVIDQYEADGYCIMTNGLIDATLHDKLESITKKRRIEKDEWDKLKFERTLAMPRNKNIRQRYFGF
jgi:hypothetical protein